MIMIFFESSRHGYKVFCKLLQKMGELIHVPHPNSKINTKDENETNETKAQEVNSGALKPKMLKRNLSEFFGRVLGLPRSRHDDGRLSG